MIAALLLLATATAAPDIDAVAATVRALPATDRDEAAASLRALSVSDPYTRAALQLPFALNVEPFAKDPATRDRVSAMIDALDHFGDASFVSIYQVGELASPTGGRTPPAR